MWWLQVNGAIKAVTSNAFDTYKRLRSKYYEVRENLASPISFHRTIEYDGARISSTVDELVNSTTFVPVSDEEVTSYAYDDAGRINAIGYTTYAYDKYGQLTRENNFSLDKTYVYLYNEDGNVIKVQQYAYTTAAIPMGTATEKTYTYDTTHPDRLINYNGTAISYNSIGCPTTYNGYSTGWTRGKLTKLTRGNFKTGTYTYNYTYNALGQRTERSYVSIIPMLNLSEVAIGTLLRYNQTFKYDTSGRLIYESKLSKFHEEADTFEEIVYLYDESGIVGMNCTVDGMTNTYYLQRNLLGDVIAIYNTSGTKVGAYKYDAWGNCTITQNVNGIAALNPIRYRGYYYDQDTKLYYLNARYYCPEWRRFISPDDTAYLNSDTANGLNLYTYCNNDPVNYADPSGHFAWLVFAALMLFTPIGGIVTQAAVSTLSYAGMAVASVFDEEVRDDMNAIGWNPFNTDESETLDSSKVSFYKGVPVFRTNGERPGSFGAIFLTKDSVAYDLRHERGHNTQLMMMGIGTYAFTVGIPSPLKLGPWDKNKVYYYAPWETMADILGGVTRRYNKPIPEQQIKNAWAYYAISTICFPLTTLYWF